VAYFAILRESSCKRLCGGRLTMTTVADSSGGQLGRQLWQTMRITVAVEDEDGGGG